MSQQDDRLGNPNPVDRHVGLRIRVRRRELGMTQGELAEAIGLTFQQVQKYERAANRISASKLWEVARVLQTTVGYFYDGLGHPAETTAATPGREAIDMLLLTPEGLDLAETFPRIRQSRVRRKILELTRSLTESDADADGETDAGG